MCMDILPAYLYVHPVPGTLGDWGLDFPELELQFANRPMVLGIELGPQEEQPVLLRAEPLLQPCDIYLFACLRCCL